MREHGESEEPVIHYATKENLEQGYHLGDVSGDPTRCCPICGSDRLLTIDADSQFSAFDHPWYAEWYRCLKCDHEFVLGTPFPPEVIFTMAAPPIGMITGRLPTDPKEAFTKV
jgi:hypothetical protein